MQMWTKVDKEKKGAKSAYFADVLCGWPLTVLSFIIFCGLTLGWASGTASSL